MNLSSRVEEPSSFRDPAGSVFYLEGAVYRQVNPGHLSAYRRLMESGLYADLTGAGLLIPHEEVGAIPGQTGENPGCVFLKPEKIPFVSWPFEWCFSQLRDAALVTLEIQRRALAKGMTLRDASAWNIQFFKGRLVLMDTLSLGEYEAGRPWTAYRQFCEHFLAPLALMGMRDERLGRLLENRTDGIDLDLACRLLPFRSRLNLHRLLHLHMHAWAQKRYETADVDKMTSSRQKKVPPESLQGLTESLEAAVRSIRYRASQTAWSAYREDDSYSPEAWEAKRKITLEWTSALQPPVVWDLGANDGWLSRQAAGTGAFVVAWEQDRTCVEHNYNVLVREQISRVLPLRIDLTNPPGCFGWANEERPPLHERGKPALVLALALIHHLSLRGQVPLEKIAVWFSRFSENLIVEFVPPEDKKVRQLTVNCPERLTGYSPPEFEKAFLRYYDLIEKKTIPHSLRCLYLYRRR